MKAVVFTKYGSPDVLELKDVEKPVLKDHEVLIRVHAASLNDWDWGALDGSSFVNRLIFGLLRPKKQILGSDIAGRIEAVGKNVLKLQPGDEVFGDLSGEWGGFAEYVCARENALALKARGMTFEQAAAIPQAAMLAVQGLRDKGRIQRRVVPQWDLRHSRRFHGSTFSGAVIVAVDSDDHEQESRYRVTQAE